MWGRGGSRPTNNNTTDSTVPSCPWKGGIIAVLDTAHIWRKCNCCDLAFMSLNGYFFGVRHSTPYTHCCHMIQGRCNYHLSIDSVILPSKNNYLSASHGILYLYGAILWPRDNTCTIRKKVQFNEPTPVTLTVWGYTGHNIPYTHSSVSWSETIWVPYSENATERTYPACLRKGRSHKH